MNLKPEKKQGGKSKNYSGGMSPAPIIYLLNNGRLQTNHLLFPL